MIDLRLLRKESTSIKKKITLKDPSFPVDLLISLDKEVIQKKTLLDELLQQSNALAKQGRESVSEELKEKSKKLSLLIESTKSEYQALLDSFNSLYLRCPNIPFDGLPEGDKEANKTVKEWGSQPPFDFLPQTHYNLAIQNKWVDFSVATRISKTGFVFYQKEAVELLYELCWWMIQNNKKYGFSPVLPPYLANEATLTAASNLPRFEEDLFKCERDNLYLIPTAEVALAGIYQDAILEEKDLPIRMTAWTSCFRREAGGYGAQEKGLIRMHQFEKVELFTLCKPEESPAEQERMLACAENILQSLNLHYRVVLLATGDCSFASSKTYDLEVWLPGQKEYREIASISNCTDFQARRAKARFRGEKNALQLVHTLNGSSLALSRLMVALMEVYQKADGSINYQAILEKINTSRKGI